MSCLDDKEFLTQIHEFFVYDFCEGLGEIDRDPEVGDGKTPELLWDIPGQKALLDVLRYVQEVVLFWTGTTTCEKGTFFHGFLYLKTLFIILYSITYSFLYHFYF